MKRLMLVLISLALFVLATDYSLSLGQDSLNVTRLGQLPVSPQQAFGCNDVAVSNGYAYLADSYYGFWIIDVSNPGSMDTVGILGSIGDVKGVAVSGSFAYAACSGQLRVIDISNPQQPFERSSCGFPNITSDVAISGNFAYVATMWGGLRVVNISDPDSIYEVGRCDTTLNVLGVAVSGNYAYLAAYISDGMRVIDISNPTNPIEVGSCPIAQGYQIAVSGNYAYTVGDHHLDIINVSNPANPILVNHFYVSNGGAKGVAISGNYAYVAMQWVGLYVVNILNPLAPYNIGYYNSDGEAVNVIISGGCAYLSDMMYFGIYQFTPPPQLDVILTPTSSPVVIPAQGGSFNFTAAVRNHGPDQAQFWVWARIKEPNGNYFPNPSLGPVLINPPVGVQVSRLRTQSVPGTWSPGIYTYIGYANWTYSYPALDSSSFNFTKIATADGDQMVWDNRCYGEPFSGEETEYLQPSSKSVLNISPDPFNSTTTLRFDLPQASAITLRAYDIAGRLVATLVDGWYEAGSHEVTFDGSRLASGMYLVRMEAGKNVQVQKIVLIK